ncbi:hypothetical protein [Mycobacterium xenopi]|uniref:Uncharacterized protein n=2 Tax=Mycobacterium xenopi TaxID=1789 RepID=A0AAD1H241_MYCXE|nr:hypothetical protein [Mycobacterium xenopi]EUA13767.1 hypothetical protein I553_6886 [Mycobacterium xenopi 4042]MDA3641467.1 hypothetical protein [Mycobacterium xenopi]MDA3659663.1 hypothetical protein [Mycobacterium xenopi]MDA3664636.1 hypothetical protein [Mycobacterium xenopi]SPX89395.1 Uncharacterised protein [Mycobacterium xenopi]
MTDIDSKQRGRDQISALVAAHGAFTQAAVQASQLMAAKGRNKFAAHLDRHRAELNVAIGEFGLWAESFGDWARVDVGHAIHPPLPSRPPAPVTDGRIGADLLMSRENLKTRRAELLAELGKARFVLRTAGLPAEEICAYRRMVRLWAGEAIDLVTGVHRLTLAEQYIRRLSRLRGVPHASPAARETGAFLLRQWMEDLEAADREGELALAETCGYGDFVEFYRANTLRRN